MLRLFLPLPSTRWVCSSGTAVTMATFSTAGHAVGASVVRGMGHTAQRIYEGTRVFANIALQH